jgi:hypothetical protein
MDDSFTLQKSYTKAPAIRSLNPTVLQEIKKLSTTIQEVNSTLLIVCLNSQTANQALKILCRHGISSPCNQVNILAENTLIHKVSAVLLNVPTVSNELRNTIDQHKGPACILSAKVPGVQLYSNRKWNGESGEFLIQTCTYEGINALMYLGQ